MHNPTSALEVLSLTACKTYIFKAKILSCNYNNSLDIPRRKVRVNTPINHEQILGVINLRIDINHSAATI
jgi:hypothetical protein